VLTHGHHHPKVLPRQPRPTRALHVEAADGLVPVEERDADLGGHAPIGPDKVGVDAHVFHELGLPGTDGAPADAFREGDAFDRLVRPGLALQHQFLAPEQVGARPGVTVGLDYGLDRPRKNAGYVQLVCHVGANTVQKGQLLGLGAVSLLAFLERLFGLLALGHVPHGYHHATDGRIIG
jgi:hypothetical protein